MSYQIIESPPATNGEAKARSEINGCFSALYRRLMFQSGRQEPLRIVGVTSSRPGEGVSTVAGRLAIAAAEDQPHKVLLVHANIGATSFSDFAGERHDKSLNGNGSHSSEGLLQATPLPNLWVLPATPSLLKPSTSEQQQAAAALLSGLFQEFSFIVIDMPHADQFGEVAGLTGVIDGILLVVDSENTGRNHARTALAGLSRFRLLGAVLNRRHDS